MRVFRIQNNIDGRGPWQPGFSIKWADDDFAPGMFQLPTWMEEFGADLLARLGERHEYFGCGVRELDKIKLWFSNSEKDRLMKLGYNVVSLRIERILAESKNQLVFARRRPLYEGAVIVEFPK